MPMTVGNLELLTKPELAAILSRYKIHELSKHEQIIVIRSQCFHDIGFFAHNITTRWTSDKATGKRFPSPPFHQQLWDIAREGNDFLCIVPRNFAKTTAVSKILVLWKLLFAVDVSIMLIMTKGLGEEVVGDIRRELETNPFIKLIWGDIVPISNKDDKVNERWRQRQLQLLNGTELKTITKGESVRGNRPTWILLDDPQENKDVKNPVLAEEFWNWIYTAVYPSLNIGGSMGVLGTVISNNCFVNKLKQEADKKKVKVVQFPAIINFDKEQFTGESLWPERWPMSALKAAFERGEEEFMQEYMNEPLILNGSAVFSKSIINSLKELKPEWEEDMCAFFFMKKDLADMAVYIGIDLASGSKDGDYTVITGRLKDKRLAFQFRGRVTEDRAAQITDKLVGMCHDVFIVPEKNNECGASFIYHAKQYKWATKMYKEKQYDEVSIQETEDYGFRTHRGSKPIIIDNLRFVLEVGGFAVLPVGKEELQYFYYNETYAAALEPYHDDTVISEALCVFAITRFSYMAREKTEKVKQTKLSKWEKYKLSSGGKQNHITV